VSSCAPTPQVVLKRKRPIGITLLAIAFLYIGGFGTVLTPLLAHFGGFEIPGRQWLTAHVSSQRWLTLDVWLSGTATYMVYVAYACIGFGLWKLRNWARRGVVALTGLFPVVGVFVGLGFRQNAWITLAGILWCTACGFWLFWYLMRPRVRYAFGAWRGGEPPGLTTKGKFLVAVLAGITTAGFFIALLSIGIEQEIASSAIYQISVRDAQSSPCAAALVGSNIAPGWFTSGETSIGAEEGSANLEIPVHGSKGKGTLSVTATEKAGAWSFNSLILSTVSGEANLTVPGLPCH
jgi:hypothetical protein